jgi:hypothetical protein
MKARRPNLNIQRAFAIKWRNKHEQTNLKKELEKSALDSWIIDCLIFSDKIRNRSVIRLEAGYTYYVYIFTPAYIAYDRFLPMEVSSRCPYSVLGGLIIAGLLIVGLVGYSGVQIRENIQR